MHKLIPMFCILAVVSGCVKSPTEPVVTPLAVPDVAGVYVLNEGNYGDNTSARLSFYVSQDDTVYRSVVELTNDGTHLGSTADDFALVGGKLYILMSGSEKLVVLSSKTQRIQQEAVFAGATPHSLLVDSTRSRIYVTALYKNIVLVVDLQSLQVLDSIAVGLNPQEMLMSGGNVFVCNSGYGSDNTVSVINPVSRTVIATLRVGAGASGITAASDGRLWVGCTGNAYATPAIPGGLYVIDPVALAVTDSVIFAEPLGDRIASSADGYVYVIGASTSYFGGPIHRVAVSSRAVTLNFLAGTYYGLGIDAGNGDLYVADAKSFTAPGEVAIFTNTGALKKSFIAERGPSQFLFKR